MTTETTKTKWKAGEVVTISQNTKLLKRSDKKLYSNIAIENYVCVREATKGQRGILVKGLGKVRRERIIFVNGKPFLKDERDELFVGKHYYSYPFPTVDDLKEVLDIVRDDMDIQQTLIDNGMFFYPSGTFWVSNTKSLLLGLKKRLQYYDPPTDRIVTAKSHDERHQRITIAYF